ncbi:hypothetical protein ACOME3_008276 [Neoechinorhynchus agilis]
MDTGEFELMVTGSIETAEVIGANALSVSFRFVYGDHWSCLSPEKIASTTQTSYLSRSQYVRKMRKFVFSHPIEVAFRSTCPYNWPKILIEVQMNHEEKAQGQVIVPVDDRIVQIPLFGSPKINFLKKILGRFSNDSDVKLKDLNRHSQRVSSIGFVSVRLNILTRNLI